MDGVFRNGEAESHPRLLTNVGTSKGDAILVRSGLSPICRSVSGEPIKTSSGNGSWAYEEKKSMRRSEGVELTSQRRDSMSQRLAANRRLGTKPRAGRIKTSGLSCQHPGTSSSTRYGHTGTGTGWTRRCLGFCRWVRSCRRDIFTFGFCRIGAFPVLGADLNSVIREVAQHVANISGKSSSRRRRLAGNDDPLHAARAPLERQERAFPPHEPESAKASNQKKSGTGPCMSLPKSSGTQGRVPDRACPLGRHFPPFFLLKIARFDCSGCLDSLVNHQQQIGGIMYPGAAMPINRDFYVNVAAVSPAAQSRQARNQGLRPPNPSTAPSARPG